MIHLNKILLSVFALMLATSSVVYAESIEQATTGDQLYAEVQQLKIQMANANQKIAALESQNKLEKQLHKELFAQTEDKLHGRNR